MTPFYCIALCLSSLLVGSWIGRQWERYVMERRSRRMIALWTRIPVDLHRARYATLDQLMPNVVAGEDGE